MVGSLNKVILIGNVGKDPEIRSSQDSREFANFSVATSETWKDKSGEKKERTEWHRISVFSQALVQIVKNYVHKGSRLYIEGNLQTREWVDQSGVKRYVTEVVVQQYGGSIILLDAKSAGPSRDRPATYLDNNDFGSGSSRSSASVSRSDDDDDDGIPPF